MIFCVDNTCKYLEPHKHGFACDHTCSFCIEQDAEKAKTVTPFWRVTFKSHSLGQRMYHIDSTDQTSAYFAMLALEQRNWFVVGIEELESDG